MSDQMPHSRLFTTFKTKRQIEKGAKFSRVNQLQKNAKMLMNSPNTLLKLSRNAEEVSLFDIDSKDSGFCEEVPEEPRREIFSPCLEDNESTLLSFLSDGIKKQKTPSKSRCLGSKKRLFLNTSLESPVTAAGNSLKRLKLAALENEDCVSNLDFNDRILTEYSKDGVFEIDTLPEERPLVAKNCSDSPDDGITEAQKNLMKEAVEKSEDEELIGDYSKSFLLPLVKGSHPEIKTINATTLKNVLDGQYDMQLASFTIIDSRFPYEYQGGHIRGARNIYLMHNCMELLNLPPRSKDERHILIFHCEFSKERGPNMIRNLRQEDRTRNGINYPALVYPEVYLLDGGYKSFFDAFPQYCDPMDYKEMLHPEHEEEMRFFKKQTKSSSDVTGTSRKGKPSRTAGPSRFSKSVRKTLSLEF